MSGKQNYVSDNTILKNVICRLCGNVLPPHTVKQHLQSSNPLHSCPHNLPNVVKRRY